MKKHPSSFRLALCALAVAFNLASSAVQYDASCCLVTVDTRDYTLVVTSAHGTPVPAVGTNTYAWQSAVTCSVNAAVSEGGTNYTCTGWTGGTGAIPATGATNNTGAIMLTSVASTLVWQWQAQISTYTVTLHPGDHGTIAGANSGSNYVVTVTNGAAFPPVTVVTNAGWAFTGWNPPAPATVTTNFEATAVYAAAGGPLADAVDQPSLVFTDSGSQPWISQTTTTHDGVDAAQSGVITHNQTSSMETTVTGPVNISFWWKVSSEGSYDYLRFYIDGIEQSGSISGTVDWLQKSYLLASSGSHTLKWSYTKDGSVNSGSDCGWVDQLGIFVPIARTVTLHPGAHGSIVGANSGTSYVTNVMDGAAFPWVTVTAAAGWAFTGWNPPAPATVTNDFEATAGYAERSIPFAEFVVSSGLTYAYGPLDINSIHYGGLRVDEDGILHMAYQDYRDVKYARIDRNGSILENTLVSTVSKRQGWPTLARNSRGIYMMASQYDKRAEGWVPYRSFWDAQLYFRDSAGSAWSQLHLLSSDVAYEDEGPQDLPNTIMPDPSGDMHVIYRRSGWWSYGYFQRECVVSASDHAISGLADIATRLASDPDAGRNGPFLGDFYLDADGALIMPVVDNEGGNYLWLSKTTTGNYRSWTQGANLLALGSRYASAIFQDHAGDVHATLIDSTCKVSYCHNWETIETISDTVTTYRTPDITVANGKIYILVTPCDPEHANGSGNLLLFTRDLSGGPWSAPLRITSETERYNNNLISDAYFARPFTYKTEPAALYVAYEAFDGTVSGYDYLGAHVRVLQIGGSTHTVTLHPGDHGSIAGANSGSNYVVTVTNGAAFPPVTVNAAAGWSFAGWNPPAPATVTTNFEATAVYEAVLCPDLSLSSTDFRILNAAGVETWSLAVGEPATLAVTVRNTGATNTAGNVLVQVFLDGSPTNLVAYDAALYTNVATATLSNAIPAGGSVTITLPWTATGPDRQLTLAVVAEFVANRAQAQSNSLTTNLVALPVSEVSFVNNSVARSLQVGTPAPNNYGIIVQAVWPADLRTGRRYELTGTAAYNWGGQQRVLGADVTVSVNNSVYLTRTLADGTWRITLDPLPLGANEALAQVSDGGGMIGSTNFTLLVSIGTPVVDLRIMELRFEGGGVYRYSGETAWCTNLSAVTVRARVRNDGNTNCSPFQVSFQAGAAAAQTATVAALAPGAEAWVTNAAAWTATPQGDVSFTATADSGGVVAEVDESNNTRSATVHVREAKPDLVVSGLSASPSTPKAGDTVTITATIRNQGAVPVAAGTTFQTGFSLGGTNSVTLASNLPPGGSVVATTTWIAQAGTYALKATADSSGVIPEDYEDNNDLTVTLAVRQALPNLAPWYLQYGYHTISGLSFSPAQPVVGDLVTMTCDIYNFGTVAVPQSTSFNVAFSVNDVLAGTVPVTLSASLPVGGKTSATMTWSSVGWSAGAVTVKAEADSGHAVSEESEADNLTTTTFQLYSPASSLVVESLAPSVWQPLPGTGLSLIATIRNDGGADAPAGGTVTFYTNAVAPGNEIGSGFLSGPVAAKGGTRAVSVAWTAPGTPQAVTLYAVLGASQNQCTVTVVAAPAPDLAVYSDFITVNPPVPNAGQEVTVSATVTNLAGSTASNVVVQFAVYLPDRGWVQLGAECNAGSLAVGEATNVTARSSIVADWPSYVVRVSVASAQSDQNPNDNVATTSFVLADTPVAEAGTNQTGFVGQTITLNGSASRNATNYVWRITGRPAGSVAPLTGAATATPAFVPDMAGVFTLELVVDNGRIASVADLVSVTVSSQPPTIATQPASQNLAVGSTAVFSVTAISTLPLSYQWYFNTNTAMADATNATLTLANVQLADAGSYSVVVGNAAGVVSSTGAVLTVFVPSPPAFSTQPVSRGATLGETVTFTVTANGTAPFSYQWLFNGTNILGATGATLTLTNVRLTNAGGYQVVVINAGGTNVSREVSLNFISLRMYAGLTISGRVGGTNRIEASFLETGGTWTPLTTLALPASPYLWVDPDSAGLPRRFYRAIPVD